MIEQNYEECVKVELKRIHAHDCIAVRINKFNYIDNNYFFTVEDVIITKNKFKEYRKYAPILANVNLQIESPILMEILIFRKKLAEKLGILPVDGYGNICDRRTFVYGDELYFVDDFNTCFELVLHEKYREHHKKGMVI